MRININFASRDYLLARKVYLALAAAIAASVLVFVYNLGVYKNSAQKAGVFSNQLSAQKKIAAEMDLKLAAIEKGVNAADVKAALGEANFANRVIAIRVFSWTTFLNRLEKVVPEGVGINNISPDFQSLNINISGEAVSSNRLMEFLNRLTTSKYFEEIPPTFHTNKVLADKDNGKTLQTFGLAIKYSPDGSHTFKSPYVNKEGLH